MRRLDKTLKHFPQLLFPYPMSRFSTAAESEITVSDYKGIRTITLNRPKVLNALNLSMCQNISKSVDTTIKALVLRGAGGKAFCAGGDVVTIAHATKQNRSDKTNFSRVFFKEEYKLDYKLATLPLPVFAILDGITMGGGIGLIFNAPYKLATSKTVYAMPETAIGFFCDVGGAYFLPRLPDNIGRYLALTGARLTGRDVIHAGVATHYVDPTKLEKFEEKLVNVNLSKQDEINKLLDDIKDTTPTPETKFQQYRKDITRLFEGKTLEDVINNLENEIKSNGHAKQLAEDSLKSIKAASPLSLKIVWEQLVRGKKINDLKDIFDMEYNISQHMMDNSDFYEGVRALLIDKDKKPKWGLKLSEITQSKVDSYFKPLPKDEALWS